MPKMVKVHIEGISPYSSSRQHDEPRLEKEGHEDYDKRTWLAKLNCDENGIAVVPAMGLKQCLDRAVKVLGMQVPGKGKATYTKHFLSGCICAADMSLGVHRDTVASVTINANADGVRGSGKRVRRIFPVISKWKGTAEFVILDDAITKPVFEKVAKEAGSFVGVGRFRPENGGLNGRFTVTGFEWRE